MAMTQEEKIEIADMVRSRDRREKKQNFGSAQKTEKRCMFLKNVQKIYQNRLHCC